MLIAFLEPLPTYQQMTVSTEKLHFNSKRFLCVKHSYLSNMSAVIFVVDTIDTCLKIVLKHPASSVVCIDKLKTKM